MSTIPAPSPSTNDLVARELAFGRELRNRQPLLWWSTLLGPFALTALILATLWITKGWEFVAKLVGTALGTFFGLGRFVILLGSDAAKADAAGLASDADTKHFQFLTSLQLLAMVTWMDLCVACLLIFHAAFLFRIPKIGPGMLKLREEGEFFMLYQPWMRRFTIAGLALFVAFPLAATGSVAGAIFGQLLGMPRRSIVLSIVLGTMLGNGGMYFFGGALRKLGIFDPTNPWNLVGGVAAIIAVIALLGWRYNAMKKKMKRDGKLPA